MKDILSIKSREDKKFSSLLTNFINQALKDFQNFISDTYEVPTSLWKYDKTGKLDVLQLENPLKYYPTFCKDLRTLEITKEGLPSCTECDKESIEELLDKFKYTEPSKKEWELSSCPLGLSRLAFVVKINGNILGVLTAGKFLIDKENQIKTIEKETDKRFLKGIKYNKELLNDKLNLINQIKNIPLWDETKINRLAENVIHMFPLLIMHCKRIQPGDTTFDMLRFLDEIETSISGIFLTEESFWRRVEEILQEVINKLRIKSAVIYSSDRENYQELLRKGYVSLDHASPETLTLESPEELEWLITRQSGILLPSKHKYLQWLHDDYIQKIFNTKDAIIYTDNIFAGKIVLIGFGFREGVYISDIEKIVLKEAVLKTFKFIDNVLSSIELDHIMAESGHLLGQAAGDIENGIDEIKEYNDSFYKQNNPKEIDLAYNAIYSGLFRLNLIIKNFYAFSDLRKLQIEYDSSNVISNVVPIDLIKIIKDVEKHYLFDLNIEEKELKYDFKVSECKIIGSHDLVELMFLNLIDNAIKYSYKNTYIKINIEKYKKYYRIIITNFGVGIAQDELKKVFDRYFQSRFKDTSKKRIGTGYGLTIAKRIVDLYYRDGSITVYSKPADIKENEERRFSGDKYITKVFIDIPFSNKQ